MNICLGLCSAYSLLYGVHKPGELLDRAASYGFSTVSICDINNLYGVHTFLEEAKERHIRPIMGAALVIGEPGMGKEKGERRNEKQEIKYGSSPLYSPRYLYCFVENRAGFSRLCEILTERNKDKDNFNPLPFLREDIGGLVLSSTDTGILRELAGRVRYLYAAITPDDLGGLEAHRALSIPLAFLEPSVFLEEQDYPVHRVLRAIALNKTVGSLEGNDAVAEGKGIFHSPGELRRHLNSYPEAAMGTAAIAETCKLNGIFDGFVFPPYGENPVGELRRRVFEGAELRYGELGDMELERIEYELGVIEKMGFSPYFLRMDDIVKMAPGTSQPGANNIRRTCGRGSGAASVVSYALGITNVDPIAHNLYFERFLTLARPDPPDIDVDFAWDERDDLIKTVIERFGREYCARVANHNFFRPRSALRETAKAYGFSDAVISRLERKIFDLREKETVTDPLWREIYSIAARIEGLPRGLGMHCGGLVITPEKVSRYAPVEKSLEGFPLLAWEKEGAEAAGFVKIDLLGNRSLAVIRDALANLEEEGIVIDQYTWRPADDRATVEALARGDSMGVFYIESPAMRQLQKKTGRGDFEHIIIHSSIIRPAANKFISEYVRRLKGGKWENLHPRLKKILDETYGILCYQEDVSKTAVALAGFNEVDADKLRKVIAKKAGAAKLAVYKDQFFAGCRNNGVDEGTIIKIWEMMLSFDGYSFCKPHSASYAMVSFQSAYLRVHYPAEFMAAVISNRGGYYRPGAYISEARRMGLLVEGPDINSSRWKYYGSGRRVIIGFLAVKGLSASGAESIIAERERGGEYRNLNDFSRRVKSGRDDIIALCPAGAFDSIAGGLSRSMQARRLLTGNTGNKNGRPGMKDHELFETGFNFPDKEKAHKIIPHSPSLILHSLWEEYRALGFLRQVHTLALWKDEIAQLERIKARRMAEYQGCHVRLIGWPITQKEVWTKDGLTMSFLSFEDETAMYETVLFPDVYSRYNKLLFDEKPLVVYGLVCNDQGAITLEVTKIEQVGGGKI